MIQSTMMTIQSSGRNTLNSYNFRIRTPDGTMYVIITEHPDGSPERIDVSAGKAGNSLAAWAAGICGLVNRLLELNEDITSIIQILSNITTWDYRLPDSNPNAKVYAGPDGIKVALLQYVRAKYVESNSRGKV